MMKNYYEEKKKYDFLPADFGLIHFVGALPIK
jgi:hypothetical protein